MLSNNPELARKIILCEKPTISEDSTQLEPYQLDKLISNVSMLSSVYYKMPEQFVKKIRDRINERLDLENEYSEDAHHAKKDDDYVDSMGVKRSDYIKDSQQIDTYHNYIQGTDLLGVEEDTGYAGNTTNALDDLLSGTVQTKKEESKNGGVSELLDLDYGTNGSQ
jgi:hypothetical protein